MFLSQTKSINFDQFLIRYIELIETRLLHDASTINPRTKAYKKLQEIYGYVQKMRIDPFRFLDYCFQTTDGIPNPYRMTYCLKDYKDNFVIKHQTTIYEQVTKDLAFIKDNIRSFKSFEHLCISRDINPFIPAQNSEIKLYIWQGRLPKDWILWDPYLSYYHKVCVALSLVDRFKKIKKFI